MRSSEIPIIFFCLLSFLTAVVHSSNIVYDGSISGSYDFVIVGGGTAGLVIASRLSENSDVSVLVLEAGDTGDSVRTKIDIPGDCYYNSLIGDSYTDWEFPVSAQAGLDGRTGTWARGKLLGGSSAVNGMYYTKPSEPELSAWHDLIASNDTAGSADLWEFKNFDAALRKVETFTAPSSAIEAIANIQYNTDAFGTTGPVDVTYPGYEFDIVGNWTTALGNLGIAARPEQSDGEPQGAYVTASSINPTNWTRSYSRSAWIDSLADRSNLAILPNATVTELVFDSSNSDNVTATAVKYAASSAAATQTVSVNKEVILAGGVIGSPHVLLLSGVGPSDTLKSASVDVVVDLPGVGQHLIDHLSTGMLWNTSMENAYTIYHDNTSVAQSAEFLSYVNSATSYINMSALFGSADNASSFYSEMSGALDSSASNTTLVTSTDSTVIAGYKAIYNATASFFTTDVAVAEVHINLQSSAQVGINAALQKPLSQGYLYINSSSAWDYPIIDPNYLSHPADILIAREAFKLARSLANTSPISQYCETETWPGSAVSTDAEWEAWIKENIATEYHPSGSCSLLPRNLGGVVDSNLKVYGTSNVRVADTSILPLAFSAHLMAPAYGVGYIASDIILSAYNTSSSSTTSTSSSSSASATSSSKSSSSNAALPTVAVSWAQLTYSLALGLAFFGLL